MTVDIYGSGQRANTNPALTKAIQDAYGAWIADTANNRTGEDTGTGEYSYLQGIGSGPMFLAKALSANGIDPTPYMNVDLGLLNSVMGYNGVNDPMKALNMISQAGPGWQDSAGYRDAIANAVANDLSPADAQKYKTDYLSSHSAGTNAINNAIKGGLVVMGGMAGAGMAGYGPAASGSGLLSGGSAAGGSSAFGGAGSITGANVLGAGDLALTAMPQVTASSLGLTGAQALGASTLGMAGSGSSLVNGIKSLNDMTGGNLGAIAGGLLGAAASGDTKTEATSQKDPWGPAQSYLKDNLKTNAAMQAQYAANPFSDQQKTAYQNSFNDSDNFRNNVAPGLLNMVNSFQPYQRQQTAVGGGYKPAAQTGLLSPNLSMPQGQSIGQIDWSKFLPKA